MVRSLSCKLYVEIKGIEESKELLGTFCLMNNQAIIHVLKPDPGLGEVLAALALKSSINRLATTGLMGEPIAAPCTCL